jgi:hypothetical protein
MRIVVIGLLLAGAVIGGIGWYNNEQEEQKRDLDEAKRKLDEDSARVTHQLDAQLLEAEVRLAETRFGQGSLYRLCHEYPPTTKEHRRKCKALDDKMARADAQSVKHPW